MTKSALGAGRAGAALLSGLVLLAASSCHRDREPPDRRSEGRLGTVRLYRPKEPDAVVFLFSDATGWNESLDAVANELRAQGVAVVGVDLRRYLAGLAASDDGCHYLISEVEDLSKRVQREIGVERYRSPLLAGVGQGATLAYAALAQSPAATVAGAVSVDPAPSLATKVPLCEGAPAWAADGGGFAYGPRRDLPGRWRLSSRSPLPARLAALAEVEQAGSRDAAERLRDMVAAAAAAAASAAGAEEIESLPLVELPAGEGATLMVVIYSGDGGWRDIDKQIGDELAKNGVPVVGLDSLRYFWHAKKPAQVARDLAGILRHYRSKWGAENVVLVGYSFGADVLPFAINRLPAAERARIVEISLLGLGRYAEFEFHVGDWVSDAPSQDALPVFPEVERLDPSRVQCFYGKEEKDTLCRSPALARCEVIRTGGGHHFGGDYRALAKIILDGARRRLTAPSNG
jgi:type IV secretory pathway VirJ component